MKPMLKDPVLNEQLEREGYVNVPLLSEEELNQLRAFYSEIHPGEEAPGMIDGIHMTSWCADYDYKMKVGNFLKELFDPTTNQYFEGHRNINHVFIVKTQGDHTTFKVHQDWNVIDENQYRSVNVWVPLYDVDASSGALWILPGSHRINRKVRGAGYLFPDYSPYFGQLEQAATSIATKAGHALIFYHSVIHGSPPNLGKRPRSVAAFTVIPEEAPLCIYFQKDKESPLEVHEPGDNFMYQYEKLREETFFKPPTEQPVKLLDSYVNNKVTQEELDVFLKGGAALEEPVALEAEPKSFWQRLFSR